MTPKEKAEYLINSYRVVLMSEDTDCGEEILCTLIAKKCALVDIENKIEESNKRYWELIKQKEEIKKL